MDSYCYKNWIKFMQLTPEEEDNLKQAALLNGYVPKISYDNYCRSHKLLRKKIRCIETGKEYDSISSASNELGISYSTMYKLLESGFMRKNKHYEWVE